MAQSVTLDQGWEFCLAEARDGDVALPPDVDGLRDWRPVAQFPTNVHLDLLAHKLIPDPNAGTHEDDVQWIGERRWRYRTTFATPDGAGPGTAVSFLAFDGLDTFATVSLNGHVVLETDNMFVPYRADVSDLLRPAGGAAGGAANTLEILFDSAFLRGWQAVDAHPGHKWGCWNGDDSRLAVRKAQYHWGWDWGPALLTCGPWRPVRLETHTHAVALRHLRFDTDVAPSLASATIRVAADVEVLHGPAELADEYRLEIEVLLDGARQGLLQSTVRPKAAPSDAPDAPDTNDTCTTTTEFSIRDPALWYPACYGAQPLYTVRATLLAADGPAGEITKKIGLRRAELVQRPLADQPGTSFFFQVNNLPVFCGGSNWIPADNFVPRIAPDRYRRWLAMAVQGRQTMVRVWGGGIYEEDVFYETCDELGVLVWQDFMFACGNYPAYPAMLASIDKEARANVARLHHHACIVAWAGNNEDYQYAESAKLTYDYANKDAASWLATDFPARYIYEKVLADVCRELVPRTAYHFGSPWGGGVDTHDATVGDIHQWNVWHGTQEPYQALDRLGGRFVSEFGMEALPAERTVDAMLVHGTADADRFAESATLDFHNKAAGHEGRLALYMAANVRVRDRSLAYAVYATQLMQAECLATAYRLWKRQWQGPGREYCGGALVWQLNDCWPATSWSICDYYLRPKLAYHAIRREMAPLTVGLQRQTIEHVVGRNPHSRASRAKTTSLAIWACNLGLAAVDGVQCVVRAWDVGGVQVMDRVLADHLALPANRSTEVAELLDIVDTAIVAVYLVADNGTGAQLARSVNWPEPLKHVQVHKADVAYELSADARQLHVHANVPVKGVAFSADDSVTFDDNLVDLVPGEVVTIGVRGATSTTAFSVQMYL